MLKKLPVIIAALSLPAWYMAAQTPAPADTSFTTYSAYHKNLKRYPQITVAAVQPAKGMRRDRDVVYCHTPTSDLKAEVFYPSGKKRRPALMIIHGGGWRSGDRTMEYPLAQAIANKGYVTICADYRLSTEAQYPAAVYDLKAAIRWIRTQADKYGIDTTKIAVLGCSAGGQLAALLGTTNGDPAFEDATCNTGSSSGVQAILDVDGTLAFIHPESGEGADKPGKPSAATMWLGADATQNPQLWQQVAPLHHVSAATPPILFLNSSIDRMHAGRNDMIEKLDSYGIYSEVHTFPDAPHPFWLFEPWFTPAADYCTAFLDKVFGR